jgi:hypothetical protein
MCFVDLVGGRFFDYDLFVVIGDFENDEFRSAGFGGGPHAVEFGDAFFCDTDAGTCG